MGLEDSYKNVIDLLEKMDDSQVTELQYLLGLIERGVYELEQEANTLVGDYPQAALNLMFTMSRIQRQRDEMKRMIVEKIRRGENALKS